MSHSLVIVTILALAGLTAASVYPDHEPRDVWHARINGNIDKVITIRFTTVTVIVLNYIREFV